MTSKSPSKGKKAVRAPVRHSEPSKCGHCSNTAPMKIVAHYSGLKVSYDKGTGEPSESGDVFELLECPVCGGVLLRKYFWHDYLDGEEVTYQVLYPSAHSALRGLPPRISTAYEAAMKVKAIDANAFGVLLRRMLEMVCIDRAAGGRNLHDRLRDLATKGEIPGKLSDVSVKLKNFGNIGAHAGAGELTQQEIPILESLSRAILEYVYSAPELIRTAEERLSNLRSPKGARQGTSIK